jgi:hypothetical protein
LLHAYDQKRTDSIAPRAEAERRLFGKWIEGYSWNMLHPDTIADQVNVHSPEGYARRLIKRNLTNLNVLQFFGPHDSPAGVGLRTHATVLVWSRAQPDVRANLDRALSEKHVLARILRELDNFDKQSFALSHQMRLLRRVMNLLYESAGATAALRATA